MEVITCGFTADSGHGAALVGKPRRHRSIEK